MRSAANTACANGHRFKPMTAFSIHCRGCAMIESVLAWEEMEALLTFIAVYGKRSPAPAILPESAPNCSCFLCALCVLCVSALDVGVKLRHHFRSRATVRFPNPAPRFCKRQDKKANTREE